MKTRRVFAMMALLLVVLSISVRAEEVLTPINGGVDLPSVEEVVPGGTTDLPSVEEVVPDDTDDLSPEQEKDQTGQAPDVYVPPAPSVQTPEEPADEEDLAPTDKGETESAGDRQWIDDAMVKVETWTGWLMEQVVIYRNDIISAAGALAFMVYSILYKKKLVPSVDNLKENVTSTMANVITNVQDYIEAFSQRLTVQQKTWTDDIDAVAEVVKKYEAIIQETQKQQTEVLALQQQLAASDARNHVYGQIMRAQVEMVHQSLSSACLLDEQHQANHKAYLKQKEMLDKLDEDLASKTVAVSEVLAQGIGEQTIAGGDAQ